MKTITDLKIKLKDLNQVDNNLNYESFNQNADHLNEAKNNLRLKSFDSVQLLSVGNSNFTIMPSRSESGKRAETTSTSNANISSYLLALAKKEMSFKPSSIFDDNILISTNSRLANQSLLKIKEIDSISKEINRSYDFAEIYDYEEDNIARAIPGW